MKAAVVTQIGKLEVLDLPMPEPGPYEVLCKLVYGATCAGTDIHLTDGRHPYPVSFPTILGHESVGRVVAAGSKVRSFREGDLISRVGCPGFSSLGIASNWGGFAEYGIAKDHFAMKEDGVPREEWDKNRVNQLIDPAIDEKTAPMIITWRETLSYVRRLGVNERSKVLVIGSGGNALSLAAHCVNSGAEVTAVGSEKRRGLFEKVGAGLFVNYKSESLSEVLGSDCGAGYDYIIDGVGTSETVNKAAGMLVRDGVIGVYGWNDRAAYGINPFKARSSFRVYADGYDEEESNAEVQAMILEGKLKADVWYDMEAPVPLERITEAYQSLRKHEAVKYLIEL